jgi:K+-transporting ATPase ATPase B chain
MFDAALVKPALIESFKRLQPRAQWRNPVMFVVWVGSALTTLLGIVALRNHHLPARGSP